MCCSNIFHNTYDREMGKSCKPPPNGKPAPKQCQTTAKPQPKNRQMNTKIYFLPFGKQPLNSKPQPNTAKYRQTRYATWIPPNQQTDAKPPPNHRQTTTKYRQIPPN